jgi:hypothetical protein
MQIKTTLRFHLTLLEYPSTKTPPTTCVGEDVGKKGTLIHCWWECNLVQPLWKKIWILLKNLNIDLSYDLVTPPWGYTQKNATQVTPKASVLIILNEHILFCDS